MTKIVNDPQQMTLFGERTPRAVIYKSESHKLHQAFNVKADTKIVQGMAVALGTDGLIEPFIPGDAGQVYLGIAVTDNVNPAYQPQRNFPVEVTVAVQGYMILNWVAKEALDCGYINPTADLLHDRFTIAEAATDESQFIAITPADEANDVIQVLIR
nr:MAG: protein of unknown function DUF2190 [Bacteriophage sp.]